MLETETSNYSEKIEQEFDPELIKENIKVLNKITKQSFSKKLSPFYLDSECQIEAYSYRVQPQDCERIYTIPTDADYIVLSQYGATIFKLFNTTNPEDIDDKRNYSPSYLTTTGLTTITRYLIEHSKNRSVIAPGIQQEDWSTEEEAFLVVGVNLPNLLQIYKKNDLYLRLMNGEDIKEIRKRNRKQQEYHKKLNRPNK